MPFYYDFQSDVAQARVWMLVINYPGKPIIIRLSDIVEHFYCLFTEMVNNARDDCRRIRRSEERKRITNNVGSFGLINLQPLIDGLEKPLIP